MGSRDHHPVAGDYYRILGAAIKERGVQTDRYFLEEAVKVADKGVVARRGRRHNKAFTLFMNNTSQTDVQRHKYSVFVVLFLLVMALNLWFAYVTFNIHYKVFTPTHVAVKPSRLEWILPFNYLRNTYLFRKIFAKSVK